MTHYLISSGLEYNNEYLSYTWPKGEKPYLGGAHGTMGIVYLIIKAL